MPLADILADIEHDAEAQIATIRADAERAAGESLAVARASAERDASDLTAERRADLEAERAALLAEARSEATATLRAAREDVVERVVARVRERLAGLRSEPGYPAVFRRLAEEALGALPDAEIVAIDPRDADVAGAALGRSRLLIDARLDSDGGVELSVGDGRMVRNTLEERLDRAAPFVRSIVARVVPEMALGPRPEDGR